MRSLLVKLVLTLVVGLSLDAAALALTLDQGVYRLQWRTTNPMEDPSSYASGSINAMSEETAASYQGLCSTKCCSGEVGQYLVIFDESKGTGKGYDTAYLLPKKSEETDLSKAAKLSLKGESGNLTSGEATIDVQFGEGESSVTKQASVSLMAYGATNAENNLEDLYVSLRLGGCWSGTVGSDAGPLEVALCDLNSNGVFGDFMSSGKGNFPQPGDGVQIRKKMAAPSRNWEPIYLSRVVSYSNRLYTMKTSKLGDTLEIRPYAGETGKVRFEAKDAKGKPVNCSMAYVYGDNGIYKVETAGAMALPPGTYKCPYAVLMTPAKAKKAPFGLTIESKNTVKISRNKESVVKLGGLIKLAVEPGSNVIVARQGERKQIDLAFSVGNDKLRGFTANREAVVSIRDSKGKQLWSGKAGFG